MSCEELFNLINYFKDFNYSRKELAHFNRCTKTTQAPGKRNAVIMGRMTYFGIPATKRPMKDRLNIILSSNPDLEVPADVLVYQTLEQAMDALETDENLKESIESVWIGGGYSVYKEAMESDRCHRIYFTEIKASFDCDAFFPEINKKRFQKVSIDDQDIPAEVQEENGVQYQYFIYERV